MLAARTIECPALVVGLCNLVRNLRATYAARTSGMAAGGWAIHFVSAVAHASTFSACPAPKPQDDLSLSRHAH
jgi:hypothetical protein